MKLWPENFFRFSKASAQKRTSLADSFQDWDLKSFSDLMSSFNVAAKANSEASFEQPHSDSTVPDAFHTDVQAEFSQMVLSRQNEVRRQLGNLDAALSDLENRSGRVRAIYERCNMDINLSLTANRPLIAAARAKKMAQQADLVAFKQENRLSRPAKITIPPGLFYVILIFVVLVESVINGAFFGELVRGGIAAGFIMALGISVINVAMGLVAGGPLRNINSIFISKRITGILTFIFWVSLALYFNLFVGHVRDGVDAFGLNGVGGGPSGLQTAVQTIRDMPLYLNNAFSYFLLVLGFIFSLIALLDKFASNDPYPDYGDKSAALSLFEEDLQGLKDEANTDRNNLQLKAIEEGEVFLRNTELDLRKDKQTATYIKDKVEKRYPAYCEYYKNAFQGIIDAYRTANSAHRDTPSPTYFDSPINLSWERIDAQDELNSINLKINNLERSVKQLNQRWPETQTKILALGETL